MRRMRYLHTDKTLLVFFKRIIIFNPLKLTHMNNLKLISARINPETLKKLDDFCGSNRYYNRNAVINGILTAVMSCADNHSIRQMNDFNPKWYDGTPIQFESKWKGRK